MRSLLQQGGVAATLCPAAPWGGRVGSNPAPIVTHNLAWEGTDEHPGNWFWFEGNFAAYERNKLDRLGDQGARSHPVTHRRLTRD